MKASVFAQPAAAPDEAPLAIDRYTPIEELPQLLTVDEAAAFAGLRKRQVYALIEGGKLAVVRFGRQVRIPRDALTP